MVSFGSDSAIERVKNKKLVSYAVRSTFDLVKGGRVAASGDTTAFAAFRLPIKLASQPKPAGLTHSTLHERFFPLFLPRERERSPPKKSKLGVVKWSCLGWGKL